MIAWNEPDIDSKIKLVTPEFIFVVTFCCLHFVSQLLCLPLLHIAMLATPPMPRPMLIDDPCACAVRSSLYGFFASYENIVLALAVHGGLRSIVGSRDVSQSEVPPRRKTSATMPQHRWTVIREIKSSPALGGGLPCPLLSPAIIKSCRIAIR